MTNTDNTRELVYLAGLLYDERIKKPVGITQQIDSLDDTTRSLLNLAASFAGGLAETPNSAPQPATNRLQSIFSNLYESSGGQLGNQPYHFTMQPVGLDRSFFPKPVSAQAEPREVDAIWKLLNDDLSAVTGQPITQLSDSWLNILEKYAATIPAAVPHLPDVSLYDHLKSVAAMALCLHDYLTEAKKDSFSLTDVDAPLVLIGGDLSGIQAFIYDIIGRSAAKNLKGRSFYLQLIVDSIVQHLLDGLRLRRANIVYSSGGGFYLLAPNTQFVRKTLPILQQEVAAKLRMEQGVRLYLAIDCQSITQQQIYGTDSTNTIGTAWSELTEKLATQKKRRFSETLATTDYAYFFEPSEAGGESRGNRDVITGEEFEPDEERFPIGPADNPDEYNQRVRKSTFEQIRLGRMLRETVQYVVRAGQRIEHWEPDERTFGIQTERFFNPLGLGQHYYFISEKQVPTLQRKAQGNMGNLLIQRVNNLDTTTFQLPGSGHTCGFTFYGGNTIPRNDDDGPNYFEELAGPEALNFKRMGILRMDVDNLGFLFKNGFTTSRRTFSRYSALSRSLDYFFKGYLNKIREDNPDFRQYTFILYSGGDDLFIVGKWDVTLRFARQIQTDFAAWTCHSKHLGISGGVAVVPPKFPIAKAAEQSADEEKRAKNHSFGTRDKNSISLFGTPLAWEYEWPIVTELKDDLKRHIGDEKNIPKALISKISTLYVMQQEQAKNGQNPSWRWLSAYDLGRARERAKSEAAKQFFDQLKTDLFTNQTYKGRKLTDTKYDFLTLLNVAARWAELEMRSENKQTD